MGKQNQLIDAGGVPDIFVSGLGDVEAIGEGVFRFTYFAVDHGDQVVVAKLVVSKDALIAALHMASKASGMCDACETVKGMPVN